MMLTLMMHNLCFAIFGIRYLGLSTCELVWLVCQQVCELVCEHMCEQVYEQVREQVCEQVFEQVCEQVCSFNSSRRRREILIYRLLEAGLGKSRQV